MGQGEPLTIPKCKSGTVENLRGLFCKYLRVLPLLSKKICRRLHKAAILTESLAACHIQFENHKSFKNYVL